MVVPAGVPMVMASPSTHTDEVHMSFFYPDGPSHHVSIEELRRPFRTQTVEVL